MSKDPGRSLAVIILAAGRSKRFKSASSKVLHELCGKPMIHYVVSATMPLKPQMVAVVAGEQGGAVEQYLGQAFPKTPFAFVTQHEQRGTADAVRCTRFVLKNHTGPVLILCGDTPLLAPATLKKLMALHQRSGKQLSILTARLADPAGYGRLVRDEDGAAMAVVEERDATPEQRRIEQINAGVYVAKAEFLYRAAGTLDDDNAQGEFYLTDIVARAAEQGGVAGLEVEDPLEVAGVNDRAELAMASRLLRARLLKQLMREGVTIVDPETTYVDDGVSVGPDSVLEPGVHLRGATRLGKNVRIGAGSVLIDATVHSDSIVLPYCVLEDAEVRPQCQIGPFAHLRPKTKILEGARIGNFVETKKTVIGKGTKANHLSYLGDAVIGDHCNIGAGTITCNYDGQDKYETRIHDGVFIGSDTQLVAPVVVGARAYVGAGSTITSDVPADALAVSRVRQQNLPGWSKRRREQRKARAAKPKER